MKGKERPKDGLPEMCEFCSWVGGQEEAWWNTRDGYFMCVACHEEQVSGIWQPPPAVVRVVVGAN